MRTKKDSDIIDIAKRRFKLAVDATQDGRLESLEDLKFVAGEQWPEEIKNQRALSGRPCLTINRVIQAVRNITNDLRQNTPSINIIPVDDNADQEVAKVFKEMIRHIEYSSNAKVAYDRAVDGAVRGGFGYFRVTTDYVSPYSFDQEVIIKSIDNPFNVYLDPSSCEPDGSDANWGFIFEDLLVEDYDEMYPKSKMAGLEDWRSIGNTASEWATDKTRRVAEYFYKEKKEVKLYLLNDGSTLLESQLKDGMVLPDGLEVVDERTTEIPVVRWCKINGIEELEKSSWAGKWIPIIPVYGEEVNIDGKKRYDGITRHARDPQRMLNFWASSETETITLAPKAPWVMAEGQAEGHEQKWATANRDNHAYLEYKPTTIGGQPVSPPVRNAIEPPVMAITNARMQTVDDLKATTGVYDASLGNRSNETSGIAIQRRSVQAQTANYHFINNLSIAQRHLGRILVDLIPKIYDTPRAVNIMGEDDSQEIVYINKVFERYGKEQYYDLSAGKYDVVIDTGPTYQTKREEAVDSILQLTKAYPDFAKVSADILVKSMDFPMSQELAERLKKTIPPEILGDKGKEKVPPQAQAQMQQMSQMVKELTDQLNEASETIKEKKIEAEQKEKEMESKERIQMAKIEADMRIALLKEDGLDSRYSFQQEINQIDRYQKENESLEPAGDEDVAMAGQYQQPTGGITPGQPVE